MSFLFTFLIFLLKIHTKKKYAYTCSHILFPFIHVHAHNSPAQQVGGFYTTESACKWMDVIYLPAEYHVK